MRAAPLGGPPATAGNPREARVAARLNRKARDATQCRGRHCRRCGTAALPVNKYCVECGSKLAHDSTSQPHDERCKARTAELARDRLADEENALWTARGWEELRRKIPAEELQRRLGGLEQWQWSRLFTKFVHPWLRRLDELIAESRRGPRFAWLMCGVKDDDAPRLRIAFDEQVRIRVRLDDDLVVDKHGLVRTIAEADPNTVRRFVEVAPLAPCKAFLLCVFRPVDGGIRSVTDLADLRLFAWDLRRIVADPSMKRLRWLRNIFVRRRSLNKSDRGARRLAQFESLGLSYADQLELIRSGERENAYDPRTRRFPLRGTVQQGYALDSDARDGRVMNFRSLTLADQNLRKAAGAVRAECAEWPAHHLAAGPEHEELADPIDDRIEAESAARCRSILAKLTGAERTAVERSLKWQTEEISEAEGCRMANISPTAHRKAAERGFGKLGIRRPRGRRPSRRT